MTIFPQAHPGKCEACADAGVLVAFYVIDKDTEHGADLCEACAQGVIRDAEARRRALKMMGY